MIEYAKEFQTLIVGLLGFIGVIITMLVNAYIERKTQKDHRRHEVIAIRTAILAELRENLEMYEGRIRDFDKPRDDQVLLFPSTVTNTIYKTLLPRIGLLSEEEVKSVHRAYLMLEEMPYRLRVLVGMDNVLGLNNEIIRVDTARQSTALKAHTAFLPSIRTAVDALESNA